MLAAVCNDFNQVVFSPSAVAAVQKWPLLFTRVTTVVQIAKQTDR